MNDSPETRHRDWRLLTTVAVLMGALVYVRTPGFDFVYDDTLQIVKNSLIRAPSPWLQFFDQNVWAFAGISDQPLYYRPLFLVWLTANYRLFGLDPADWHISSVVIHASVTLLVSIFARSIGLSGAVAGTAALIFAVHPIHVESVAWVSGVVDPLCPLFILLAASCHLRWRAHPVHFPRGAKIPPRAGWAIVAVVACGLAVLCKKIGATIPALIFALEWFSFGRQGTSTTIPGRIGRAALFCLPYVLVVAIYLVVRASVLGSVAPDSSGIPMSSALLTVPVVVLQYLRMFLVPVELSIEYGLAAVTRPGDPLFVAPLLTCAALAVTVFIMCRRRPIVATAVLFASITVFPALLLWKLQLDSFVHDRYLYIPSVGLCTLVAMAMTRIPRGDATAFDRPALPILLGAALVFVLAATTVQQTTIWKDSLSLYSRANSRAPSVPHVQTNYAGELLAYGRVEEAAAMYQSVLDSSPKYWPAVYGLGHADLVRGSWHEAIGRLEHAVELNPGEPDQYVHLGYAHLGVRDLADAERSFREAIRRQPLGLGHHNALGVALMQQGRLSDALAAFEYELVLNPGDDFADRQIGYLRSQPGLHGQDQDIR